MAWREDRVRFWAAIASGAKTRGAVVDGEDQGLSRVPNDEFVAIEGEPTDYGMVDREGPILPGLNVLLRPEGAKAVACEREFTDEIDESCIVRVGSDRAPEPGDETRGGVIPVRVASLLIGVEEHVLQAVMPPGQAR